MLSISRGPLDTVWVYGVFPGWISCSMQVNGKEPVYVVRDSQYGYRLGRFREHELKFHSDLTD